MSRNDVLVAISLNYVFHGFDRLFIQGGVFHRLISAASDFLEAEIRKAIFRTSTVTVRANTTAYSLGDRVMLGTSDLSIYECITAGTSDGSPPAFNTTLGDSTTDGTVVWLTLAAVLLVALGLRLSAVDRVRSDS